jgi:hypothetical protein
MTLFLVTACAGLHGAPGDAAGASGSVPPGGQHYVLTSYGLRDTVRATVGSPIVSVRTGFRYAATNGHLWREDVLSYAGMTGTVLHLAQRAWTSDGPGPAEELALQYDLARSRIIKFRAFTFEVVDANDSEVTLRVLGDGGLSQAAGHPAAPGAPPPPAEPSLTL